MKLLFTLLVAASSTALLLPSWQEGGDPAPVEAAELGGTVNVHRAGSLWFGGQFQPQDLKVLEQQGIRRVITLRTEGEVQWDEKALVEGAGMEYVALPFRAPETLTAEVFGDLRQLLGASAGAPTLLHCGSANRVGGAWIPFRVLDQGVPLDQAVAEAKTIGLRNPAFEELAIAYVEDSRKLEAKRADIKPGLNDNFKDPELDVERYIGRFEVESREVYASRHEVVKALGLKPGMHVADIGAGTGLYTFPFADAVGGDGWVYAVDIAPRFLQHIFRRAAERKVANLTGVLCSDTTTGLPPASIDLAYICDTYHHFEFPSLTLASVLRALRPGGRLVVIDFERIPGVTRDWLLDHVRAGKDVFRAEIEAAGFVFDRELDVKGLEENYVLEFHKPKG